MKTQLDKISQCGGIDVKCTLDISDILIKIRFFFSDLFKQDLSIQSNYIQLKKQFEEVEEQGGDEEIEANIFRNYGHYLDTFSFLRHYYAKKTKKTKINSINQGTSSFEMLDYLIHSMIYTQMHFIENFWIHRNIQIEQEWEEQQEEQEQEEQIIDLVFIPLRFDENKRHEKRMKKLTRKQFINRKEGQFRKMDSADKQMRMKKVKKR